MDIGAPIPGIALCRCGCGRPAPLARQRDRLRNYEKGQPTMFVHGHHGRRNTVAAGAVDALDLPAALSAPTASSIPVPTGVPPDVHERFWSVVARSL